MCEFNQTQVTHIKLLGFQGLYKYKILIFIGFLLPYLFILSGNILIIIIVETNDQLKIPMFFFLKHLAAYDVLMTTSVIPMALDIIIKEEGNVPLAGCFIQLYCLAVFGYLQSFLIAAMSSDRYLAICKPLRYSSLMNSHVCSRMIIGFWVLAITLLSSELIELFQLNYCGLNSIDHFFCDFGPLVGLSTSDTSVLILQDFINSTFTFVFPFVIIIITYICIVVTILKMFSISGQRKAFSTCSSHLSIVCAFYGTLIIVYVAPSDDSSTSMNKYRALAYTLVSPLMNPIIYSLRNHEIKRAMKKLLSNIVTVLPMLLDRNCGVA
ncbi:PREDICTED: olfactory receptor 510-like [Nanorana parkeri]|uniref:olfactory receptor 510-like n=1 Tax=Nanorana parkeri TaxID=125878 RepID=UPI0008541F8A|nr:PREDICTED: olfactory receptor 510-like [Nanorana parkeri]